MDKDTLRAIEIIVDLLEVLYSGLMYSGDERFIELDKIINDGNYTTDARMNQGGEFK